MDLNQCNTCKHARDTAIFKLCTHTTAEYIVGEKHDYHTRTYMAKRPSHHEGPCPNYELKGVA